MFERLVPCSFYNINLRNKLLLMLALPSLYLLYLSATGIWNKYEIVAEMNKLEALSSLAVKISGVIHETQKERGATAGYLGSQGRNFSTELSGQAAVVDREIYELNLFLKDFDSSRFGSDLKSRMEKGLDTLKRIDSTRKAVRSMSIATSGAIDYYTAMNTDLLNVIALMPGLSSDSQLMTVMSAYVDFLQGKERAGIERAVMSDTFARGSFGPSIFRNFASLVAAQETYLDVFKSLATKESVLFYENVLTGQAVNEVARMRDIAFEKAAEGKFGVDAAYWFKTMTEKINLLKRVEDSLSTELNDMTARLKSEATTALILTALVTSLILALVFVFAYVISSGISKPVRELNKVMDEIAAGEGDLTKRMEVRGQDEIARIAVAFNNFMEGLQNLIRRVRRGAEQVASASTELSLAAEQMSAGAETQNRQAVEVASSVEAMHLTALDVARNSSDASESASVATSVATAGGDVVKKTIEGMSRIAGSVKESAKTIVALGESSNQIGEIIDVINDIADQTNLLALNAAIEAARAGEQGRGFSVVADEVRKLAERTTRATKEISSMIETIQADTKGVITSMSVETKEVEKGVALTHEAGGSLNKIVDVVTTLTMMISQIAVAAEEQSAAAEETGANVEAVASISRETAEGARQSLLTIQALTRQAEELQKIVGQFKLN